MFLPFTLKMLMSYSWIDMLQLSIIGPTTKFLSLSDWFAMRAVRDGRKEVVWVGGERNAGNWNENEWYRKNRLLVSHPEFLYSFSILSSFINFPLLPHFSFVRISPSEIEMERKRYSEWVFGMFQSPPS